MCGYFKRIASLEVSIEVSFAIKMHQEPAVHLCRDEDRIPGLFASHIQRLVTDKAPAHACLNRSLEPLIDELVKVLQVHHIEA